METLTVIATIFSISSFMLVVWALIEIKSMQRSTHTFEYLQPPKVEGPVDESGFAVVTEKDKKELFNDDDLFGDETVHTHLN